MNQHPAGETAPEGGVLVATEVLAADLAEKEKQVAKKVFLV